MKGRIYTDAERHLIRRLFRLEYSDRDIAKALVKRFHRQVGWAGVRYQRQIMKLNKHKLRDFHGDF